MKHKLTNTFFLIFLLAFLAGFLAGFKSFFRPTKMARININQQVILAEVADTPEKISQGLSERDGLPKNQGMLFVFTKPYLHLFWMNKMRFGLDFIFINDNQIVDFAEAVPFPKPGEEPWVVRARQAFNQVLEVNAGTVKDLKIKIGDLVEIKNN